MRGVRQRELFWPATIALLACLCAAQLFPAWQESNIGDEPVELAAGYSYVKTGDFRMNPEHPPLAKILAALPLLALQPSLPLDSTSWGKADEYGFGMRFFERNIASIDRLLFAARLVSIFLTACLGLALALWTRDVFSLSSPPTPEPRRRSRRARCASPRRGCPRAWAAPSSRCPR